MQFAELAEEVARLWTDPATAKGPGFVVELEGGPSWIVSDPSRLRQLLFNLLSNALKFTATGAIGLRADLAPLAEGERLRIAVFDTGIGIPDDKLEEIFESFRQADSSTTRQYGGTGLGLTICRNLAQALGGEIYVTSVKGTGSTFTLDLPLVRADAPAEAAAAAAAADAGAGVLLIERNPITRAMLRSLFEAAIERVRFANDIQEALQLLELEQFAALVIDEAALATATNKSLETIAILCRIQPELRSTLLWSGGDADQRAQFLDAGLSQVIEKPIAGAELVHRAVPPSARKTQILGNDPLVSQAA